jgi:hypothetical protein
MSDGNFAYEMQTPSAPAATRQRSASGNRADLLVSKSALNAESGVSRSNTTGRRVGEGLKRRFGSLRRSKKTADEI